MKAWNPRIKATYTEVGIYKRKQESKKTRKHAFDQESDQEKKTKRKKTRSRPRKKNVNRQEKKRENTYKKNFLFFSYFLVFFYRFSPLIYEATPSQRLIPETVQI